MERYDWQQSTEWINQAVPAFVEQFLKRCESRDIPEDLAHGLAADMVAMLVEREFDHADDLAREQADLHDDFIP